MRNNHNFDQRLLLPGWGGELTPDEVVFIKGALKCSARLRRRWGFKTTRIRESKIREVAMHGVDKPRKSVEARAIPPETYLDEKGK